MKTVASKAVLSRKEYLRGIFFLLSIGLVLFCWQLGSTGLVDETPPLFAAAGRAMHLSGDWLTPRANGLPRFDKPPLVYWLMGLFYSLPGQIIWDPLGTWAARLPSALSSLVMMLMLGDTVMRYPQKEDIFPRRTAVATALSFALSPLVMIWSRIAVSDALLCSTFGVSMLLQWRRLVNPTNESWWAPWIVLGFAVLAKGPVAIVLMVIALFLFGLQQGNFSLLFQRLNPIPGLLITLLISLPWYLIELLVEGKPFWDSFFGYHNFQRFTSVVNSHLEPWWFFGVVLVVASLPFTPFLILSLSRASFPSFKRFKNPENQPYESLIDFSSCWLVSVLLLFTCAATKLPSYWIPATPAAALLIGISANSQKDKGLGYLFASGSSILLAFTLSLGFWMSPLWLTKLNDPEMPSLGVDLLASGLGLRAAAFLTISGVLGIVFFSFAKREKLLAMQAPLVFFYLLVTVPLFGLGDRLRQLPLRKAADLLLVLQKPLEPLVMVGAAKPSMHFYTKQVIVYEGRSSRALVNLAERLSEEQRDGWRGRPLYGAKGSPTALVVIDTITAQRPHWIGLGPEELGRFGIYMVWRLDRQKLDTRAQKIIDKGIESDWRRPRPERF